MTAVSAPRTVPSPDRWQRAAAIFGAALGRDPRERPKFIVAACGDDDLLREEVLALLTEHEREGSFLSEPLARLLDANRPAPSPRASPVPAAPRRSDGEPVTRADLAPPYVLAGRYAIQRVLGRGGMATVYLATDVRHPRSVAVKVLHPEIAASVGRERFVREIRITAGLVHPHILPMHESGEADGLLFYVMPYVVGETLRAHLTRTGRLPLEEALRVGREVADALAYAHAHGVVHRDVKPENILLSDGHAVVADFGIGHVAGDTLTRTGYVVGTPPYMSPEQAAGDRTLDGRADIYSLGCVVYEMLAGKPPRRGATPALPVRTLRGDVPSAVEQALGLALADDPAQRFATARQFADVLARAHGTDSFDRSTVEVGRRWAHARAAVAAAFAGLVALALGVLAWWLRPEPPPPLVTVAPFHIASGEADLQRWNYDLPLLIASRLDAARPLRASTPAVGVGRQPEVTSRSAAAALGRRTGAQYVVFGRVLRDRQRAVRVEAEVVDVAREEVVDEVHASSAPAVTAADGALPEMTDSLTRALLTSFGASMPVAATRHAAFGCASSSWPAVMSYLRGEQLYRRTQWDSAVAAYQEAIALDSGCALAYHRIAVALGWQGYSGDSAVTHYKLTAGAHNHGLAPRDSLLVTADSLGAAADLAERARGVPATTYWAYVRRLLATLEEGTRRYPGDSEMWYALADARYHHGWGPAGTTTADILAAFDQAIRQDSGFAPSYLHPIDVAYRAEGRERAMRYVHAYLATRPTGLYADGVRLVAALSDPRTARAPETLRRLADDSIDVLYAARNLVDAWPDSAEAAVRLTRVIAQRSGGDTLLVAGCRGGFAPRLEDVALARRLAYRGRLRESVCALGDSVASVGSILFGELAALGGVPDTLAARVYDGWLATRHPQRQYALAWWAGRRDTSRLDAFVRAADSVLRAPSSDAVRRAEARYDLAAAHAYQGLARADTAGALTGFAALPATECLRCFRPARLTHAEVLAARRRLAEADAILREWRGASEAPSDVRIELHRGRIAERRGDRDEAVARYRIVVRTWRHADPVLGPVVAEARGALRRLGAP